MIEDRPRKLKDVKRQYDELSATYDEFGETFESKLEQYFRRELIEEHLPKKKGARILDAGGGTGRTTLHLARTGYRVTLCDLSSGMLDVAKEKLGREGLNVEIIAADIGSLPFEDEIFDLVICLAGPLSLADSSKAAGELSRVLRKGGKIIVDAFGRYRAAMREFSGSPGVTIKLLKFELNYAYDRHGDWGRVFSPEELRGLFERNSIRVVGIYGRFMEFIPKEIQEAREWSGELFSTVYEIKRHLRNEPLVIGMADELILVGEKLPSRGDVR